MKKTLMIALAGMMLFAFTQCGSNDSNKKGDNKDSKDNKEVNNDGQDAAKSDNSADFNDQASSIEEPNISGTEQFNDNVKLLNGMMEAIDKSKSCEDLQTNLMAAAFMALSSIDKEYADGQMMTEDEQKQLEKISEEYTKALEKKQKELGCEEAFGGDDDLDGLDPSLFDDDLDLDLDLDLDDEEDDDEDDDLDF